MSPAIRVHASRDAGEAAQHAARIIADAARAAISERGKFVLALSGGATPLPMFRALAAMVLDGSRVQLFQVDERFVRAGSEQRNLGSIEAAFAEVAGGVQIEAMPVEDDSAPAAARAYEHALRRAAGDPPVLDLVHLGLGEDGHTASLLPGDAVVALDDADVGITGFYRGSRRMTLTLPIINRARMRLWLVCGASKTQIIRRLLDGDRSMPAGRVSQADTWLVTDRAQLLADRAAS